MKHYEEQELVEERFAAALRGAILGALIALLVAIVAPSAMIVGYFLPVVGALIGWKKTQHGQP